MVKRERIRCPSEKCTDTIAQGTRGLPYTRPASEVVAVVHAGAVERFGDGARVTPECWSAVHITARLCPITREQFDALRMELAAT